MKTLQKHFAVSSFFYFVEKKQASRRFGVIRELGEMDFITTLPRTLLHSSLGFVQPSTDRRQQTNAT